MLRLYLSDDQEELLPIVEYEGVTLINQNVKVDCTSSHPDILYTYGEVVDLEGFFCKMEYRGSPSYKEVPSKVMVTVGVSAVTKQNSLIYKKTLKTFEVKLNSKVNVEKEFQRGVNLDSNERMKQIKVLSVGDFEIDTFISSDDLIVKRSVTGQKVNQYKVTLHVPTAVVDDFSGTVRLRNK